MSATQTTRALLRTMPVLALVAPLVIFGFIYVLAILPARRAAADARADAEAARAALVRTSAEAQKVPVPAAAPPIVRVSTASELAEAVNGVADSQSVGGVDRLSVHITGALVSVNFDARLAQLDEFFSGLDAVTGPYAVQNVDIAQNPNMPLVHATVELLARGEPTVAPPPAPAPVPLVADSSIGQEKRGRVPFSSETSEKGTRPLFSVPLRPKQTPVPIFAGEPDPVVRTILFSSQQKSALVDGRIVRPGDRVGGRTVQSIEADGVVLVGDDGRVKRLALESSQTHAIKR